MVFPVVTYGCESWTVKKAERRRTDVFELWCWRRLLRVPWTARRANQSILEKTLMLGGIGGGGEGDDRGWDGWMTSPTRWTWVWINSRSWWWTGRPGVLRFMGSQRVRHDWVTELNWMKVLHPSSCIISKQSQLASTVFVCLWVIDLYPSFWNTNSYKGCFFFFFRLFVWFFAAREFRENKHQVQDIIYTVWQRRLVGGGGTDRLTLWRKNLVSDTAD